MSSRSRGLAAGSTPTERIAVISSRICASRRKAYTQNRPYGASHSAYADRMERLKVEAPYWERFFFEFDGDIEKISKKMGYCASTCLRAINDLGLRLHRTARCPTNRDVLRVPDELLDGLTDDSGADVREVAHWLDTGEGAPWPNG